MSTDNNSAKYEQAQQTQVLVSALPANILGEVPDFDFLSLECSTKDITFNRGQKQDVEVTTLGSKAQEFINGLAAAGECTIGGNFVGSDEGQQVLERAYINNEILEFRIILPSGYGYAFLAEIRDMPLSISVNSVVGVSFSLRIAKGAVKQLTPETTRAAIAAAIPKDVTTKAVK